MGGMGGPGVFVLNKNSKREQGRKAQLTNISAGKTVASIIRTTLGPRAMLKMLLDPMGGIVMTNDGNAILREVDVSHPAAKNMIELSRAQDEEDGLKIMDELAYKVDTKDQQAMRDIVQAGIDTKFASRWGTLIADLAIKAVNCYSAQA